MLVGIAIDQGLIKSVDQRVYTFFPKDTAFVNDPLKREITIKDLLEMQSGFDCDEWSDSGKVCEDDKVKSLDWVKFSLAVPMKYGPAYLFARSSAFCGTTNFYKYYFNKNLTL